MSEQETHPWISMHDEEGVEWIIPAGKAWRIISKTDDPENDVETIMTLESGTGKRMTISATKTGPAVPR